MMQNVNGWLMALAFLLGLVLTLFLLIRRVKREVPEYATLAAGAGGAAAGATGAVGAAKLKGGAGVVEDEPYGAGSVRVKATGAAPDGGYTVKGNEDSMLYHTTDSPSWKQTIAEIWFRDVKSAERAGFARWDSGGGAAKAAGAAAGGVAGGAAAAKLAGGAGDDDDVATTRVPKVDVDADAATAKVPTIEADADDAATSKFSAAGASGEAATDADAGASAKPGAIAAGAVAAGAAVAGGAAAAKFAGSSSDETAKNAAFTDEPYGAGSARVAAGAAGPSGYDIKGNEDSMLYHTTESPSYKQTIAEVWFRDEPSAQAAGFTRWDRGRAGAPRQ
jgi:hypothetical protein